MNKILNDLCTEKDGDSIDPVRVCGLLSFLIYNAISLLQIFRDKIPFDYIQYATGMAIILGAIAAGITFKYSREKDL